MMVDTAQPAVSPDSNVLLWSGRVADAQRAIRQYEQKLADAQATLDEFGGVAPPEERPMTGRFGGGLNPFQRETNPDYTRYAQAESTVRQLGKVKEGTAGKTLIGEAKAYADALKDLEDAQTKLASAQKSSPAKSTPDIRTVNGVPMERGADGVYRPVQVGAQGADGTAAATGTTTASKAGTVTKMEKGPDGATYSVTYKVDEAGNQTWDGNKPTKVDLGTDPNAAVELQTAQLKLQQAQQALANEQDPLKRQQLQTQVEQARFNLEQAQAKAPIDLQIAQTNLAQAQQNLNKPSVSTVGGRAVGINPQTGERVFTTELMSPEDRARTEETAALDLEAKRRGQLPTNAYAAYTQEATRLQEVARQELSRLQELQRTGALSATEASDQFNRFFKNSVETPLAGLRASAEEAQRTEREKNAQLQREEDWRVAQFNRVREQAGLEAGNAARTQAIAIAPQVRTPQFLQQYGQAVANLSQRAGAPNAEAALAMPAGQRITADTFNPANFKGAIPDIEQYAKQASDRALAAISPAVAARIGNTMPALPGPPDLSQLLTQLPYQGPLLAAPKNGLPTPGQEAVDIGGGLGRTYYGPTGGSWLDWQIPA